MIAARWLWWVLLWVAAWPSICLAGPERPTGPTIGPGREADVLALFRPHALGAEVAHGFRLMNVSISRHTIDVELVRANTAGTESAWVTLAHVAATPVPARASKSFAIDWRARSDDGHRAAAALVDAICANDDGTFWALAWGDRVRDLGTKARSSVDDGLVWALLIVGAVTFATVRELQTRSAAFGLLVATCAALALRLALAPRAALDVWPYSRLLPLTRGLVHSPWFQSILKHLNAHVWLTDLNFTVNLIASVLTVPALFAHARPLFDNARVALVASVLLSVSPVHIRFSQSDTAFMQALLLSSLSFAFVHRAALDRSRFVRVIALVALPVLLFAMCGARPLNLLFLPLLLFQALLGLKRAAYRVRALLSVVIAATAVVFIWGTFIDEHGEKVRELATARWGSEVVRGLFQPAMNTLLAPRVTPPLLVGAAAYGAYRLYRERELRTLVFLLGWAFVFYAGHMVVRPDVIEMQARYQVHLAIPCVLLGAYGLWKLYRARPLVAAAGFGVLLFSPLVHARFIQDVSFNDMREFAFVERHRSALPEGCTVLEHVDAPHDARFARMATRLEPSGVSQRYAVVPLTKDGSWMRLSDEAEGLLLKPPPCLAFYEGLPCAYLKDPKDALAPVCQVVLDRLPWHELAATEFPHRHYDRALTRGLADQTTSVRLRLWLHTRREP